MGVGWLLVLLASAGSMIKRWQREFYCDGAKDMIFRGKQYFNLSKQKLDYCYIDGGRNREWMIQIGDTFGIVEGVNFSTLVSRAKIILDYWT